jgi:hypothetical protein
VCKRAMDGLLNKHLGDVLADAADIALVAFYRDGDFLEDEVVFFMHFIARGDDQVGISSVFNSCFLTLERECMQGDLLLR